MFTVDKRKEFIELATSKYQNIKVIIYDGLTVDFCKKTNSALRSAEIARLRFFSKGVNRQNFSSLRKLYSILNDFSFRII